MSYYARNLLQDDWDGAERRAAAESLAAAEHDAGRRFDRVTERQRADHVAAMQALIGLSGPRWRRARAAARAQWKARTAAARALFDRTVVCLLETGEISAELDDAWTALESDNDQRGETNPAGPR